MPADPDKYKLRELKRSVKKRGNKHRRAHLKRDLIENPEEAAHAVEKLGRYRSDSMNGIDHDNTRQRNGN